MTVYFKNSYHRAFSTNFRVFNNKLFRYQQEKTLILNILNKRLPLIEVISIFYFWIMIARMQQNKYHKILVLLKLSYTVKFIFIVKLNLLLYNIYFN